MNAFRVIERLERLNILGGQNTQSVNCLKNLVDSSLTNLILSGVSKSSIMIGPLLFILFNNQFLAYADDTTLYSNVKLPNDSNFVAYSINEDLCGMKINPTKSHNITISRCIITNPCNRVCVFVNLLLIDPLYKFKSHSII